MVWESEDLLPTVYNFINYTNDILIVMNVSALFGIYVPTLCTIIPSIHDGIKWKVQIDASFSVYDGRKNYC